MTNITEKHRKVFNALLSGEFGNFALFSCFVNGEPSAAIVAVNNCPKTAGNPIHIAPLFVAVTPGMELKDHDGIEPTRTKQGG